MQYHLNGYKPGDPDRHADPKSVASPDCDVLIVGCGPAGLTLAAQLSAFDDITTRIVERKPGPLELGQADGIAVRTVEMFQAFGFAHQALREAYWVNETVFWKPDPNNTSQIARSGRIQDTEDGLSEFPHLILNQARVHDFYLDIMARSAHRLVPDYNCSLADVTQTADPDYPITTTVIHSAGTPQERTETIRTRYLVGCDGARSTVRQALDLPLHGEAAKQAWGVMDVLATTDFPDIRLKAAIQSAGHGNILIIPREGGYMVRFYIELDKLDAGERVSNRNITADHLITAAQRILHPYTLDVKEVVWWSVYEIGQRLCDRFDSGTDRPDGHPNIFIAGDACHTHSPKAGQGMNVSMQDAFNLGWKLAEVLRGLADPKLLSTYSDERQTVAKELIDFDREFAAMFSARAKTADGAGEVDPAVFQRNFIKHGRYTAGTATCYQPSLLTGTALHQDLANGFPVGKRFHSAPAIRLADAKPMQLGHVHLADGRWRLYGFAPKTDDGHSDQPIAQLCRWLDQHPVACNSDDPDARIDLRAIFQQTHRALEIGKMPNRLRPAKGRYGLMDMEKIFAVDPKANIFDMRAIDRDQGCMILVRPDQYVAQVLPLSEPQILAEFFASLS